MQDLKDISLLIFLSCTLLLPIKLLGYNSDLKRGINSSNNENINGDINTCFNFSAYYYVTKYPPAGCVFKYSWRVKGGKFSNGQTQITGQGKRSVNVIWEPGKDNYELTVFGNQAFVDGCESNTFFEIEGFLHPNLSGDANETPVLSTWYFDGDSDDNSLICSDDGTFKITESSVSVDYQKQTRLTYKDSDGADVVIKDWGQNNINGYEFSPEFEDLHGRTTFIKQSRYVNCTSVTASQEFTIDFYKRPEMIRVGDPSPPKCNSASGAVTYKINSTNINKCIFSFEKVEDGNDLTYTSAIPPNSIVDGYSYFNLNSSLEAEYYDWRSKETVTVELNLETADWKIDVEFEMKNGEGDLIEDYPCSVSDSFTIGPVPSIDFPNDLSAPSTVLNCLNSTTTLTVEAVTDAGESIEYQLFENRDNSLNIDGIGKQQFSDIGPGEYYVIAKYIDCSFDKGPTATSKSVTVDYHEITISNKSPSPTDMEGNNSGNGKTLKCHNGFGEITLSASDTESGTIDYRLINSDDEVVKDTEDIPSGEDFTFDRLGTGEYTIEAKYSGCTNWAHEGVDATNVIKITAPDPISLDKSKTKNDSPPKCENGNGGVIIFSGTGGNGSLKIISATINNVEVDGESGDYLFKNLQISGLDEEDNITSITVEDSQQCTEDFDDLDYTIPNAVDPLQFTYQKRIQPKCYNSNGIFEFIYDHDKYRDENNSIKIYVVPSNDSCLGAGNCSQTNNDVDDSIVTLNTGGGDTLKVLVDASAIVNGDEYKVFIEDDFCKIVSNTISFNRKFQPEFSSPKDPFKIPCKYGSMDIKLPMDHNQGSIDNFDLKIERKPSGEAKFKEADLDTVQMYRNSDNELVIRNLYEGDYKISGTDGKGCAFKEHSFKLNQPDQLLELTASPYIKFSANGTDYHISEYGVADGKIDFEAEGGEFNYIFYLYKNSQFQKLKTTNNEGSFDGLKALDDNGDLNEYFIGVRDSRNCFKRSETFTLTQPDSLIFTYELNNYISSENDTFNIECNGGADTIRVETEGGVYPHLVELLKGDNTEKSDTLYSQNEGSVFQDISQGRYKIKVTDKFDTNISSGYRKIIDIDSIDFVQPDSLSVITNMTQPICYGDSTGSIIVAPLGGVSFANEEYDIHIFDHDGSSILNETTNELSIIADEGIYYYTIFDAFNCEYKSEDEYFTDLGNKITVTELSPRLSIVEDTVTYPPCAGDETATLSVNASGGRSEDGNYILELYDNNDPPLYGPNPLIDSVSTVESGYYTFQNLFAGDYTIIAYDDSLCSEMIPIKIKERSDSLDYLSVEPILAKCANSSDAQLKIISIGGDSPHTYSLNNTDFSPSDSITYSDDSTETYYHKTFTGLIGDSTYTIYLKDDNYYEGSYNNVCLIDTSQTIPKTPSLALDFEKTDIKCFGEENGDFTLSPSYGDMDNINDFTIDINGPNGVVSHDQGYVNNLSPGRYKIKITLADTTACKTPLDQEIYIDQPEPLVVDIFSNTEYNCSSDEEIILNGEISGGLSTSDQFLYAINSDNSADFDLLEVSNSTFRIKEKLEPGWNVFFLKSSPYNCVVSDSFFVESEQPRLEIVANQAASCFGNSDGEIRVTSSFEKLNFMLMNDEDTFSIDDSEAESVVFEGLKSGNYQLTGSSSSCLSDTLEIFVNQPDSLMFLPEIIDQPSCNQANGIGSLSILGGTSPYEIFWQLENGNILDSTSLKSGYYDIIVEDANNCSAILTDFFVEESNDFMVSVDSLSNPTCGKDNGSISIQTIGGVPPFDINWYKNGDLFIDGTDSLTSLSEGTYIYSVEDAMGCVSEDSVTLDGTEPISIDISAENLADCDTQNGSVTLTVSGGAGPYTYSWPDSIPYADGNYAEGLWGAKIYTVSVTDANLCSKEYEFAIGNKDAPEIAVHATNPKCGLANGNIEIELLSEFEASYEWRGFKNTSSTLENISSGIYFVTVTANNCPITKRIELTDDTTNSLVVNPILTKAGCNNTGGEIDLNISGGIQPYTITWDDTLLKSDVRSGLSSGNYSFKVTDSVGCIVSKDIYLDKEELPQLSLNSLGNAACGETDGYIQLDSLSSEFTFKWSHNNLLNDDLAENLSSGLYSVYAVNEAGCNTDTVSYYISSSNTDLRIQEVAVISASCNESADGFIEVNAVNGVPPYQYEWNDDNQQTGKIAKDLRPGTYTVRVTDATNCSRVKSITLGQVNPVHILGVSKNAPSCSDAADGSISITAAGGKGNYSYEWSTGATTPSITGLESGEYSVTVYDNNVCSDQIAVSITAPDMISVEYSTEKPKCYSTADGQVELSVSGGIPPYKVEWHDGATLNRRFDLAAGSYNVFISDNNNCSINKNIIVPAKDSVTIDYEITSVSCNGGNDGNVRIQSISNANNPKVVWSNGQIGNTLRNVSSGFYAADITDSYGCATAFEFEVDSPDPLQIVNDSVTKVLCKNGFNGSIIFDVIGGNGSYSFNWDDGPRSKNRFNLTAGNYKVTVLDDLNCRIEKQFTVNEPNLLVLDYTAASVSCFGNTDGHASLEINGGIKPYQISWGDGATDSVRNDLAAGTHDVLVTDANNCSKSIEVSIPNINPIRIDEVIQTIPSCYQSSDGELELAISGGNAPYTVNWDNGKIGASIDSISAGNYRVTITDDKNCQLTELIALEDASPIYLTSLTMANPICYGEPSGVVEVVPDGGNPPFEVLWEDGTSALNRGDLLAGSHTFEVVDSKDCSVSYKISLQDPPLEVIEGLPSEVILCTGGVANLDAGEWNSYNWTSDNGFSRSEREVTIDAVGNYNLAVTNEAGCIDNHPFTVTKDDDLLTADFLLTTKAVVQDTVVIVDVSWKVPDSVRWINPDDPDFYLVSQTEEYQEVIFTRTGKFELKMKAKLQYCESDVSKTITVLSKEEAARISDEEKNNVSKDFHISTAIYPNPNFGDFRIEMKGNKQYDHSSRIIDVNSGIEYYRFEGKKQKNYVFNIEDNRLPDGVYLLMMETEGKTITKRFIVK